MASVLVTVVAVAIIGGVFALLARSGGTHAEIEIRDDVVHVMPVGLSKLFAFRGLILVPVVAIEGVRTAADIRDVRLGIRRGGTSFPGVVYAGHFGWGKNRTFAVIGRGRPVVVITTTGLKYRQVAFSAQDPHATLKRIEQAR